MTKEELAGILNNISRSDILNTSFEKFKSHNLVVVYGASDDLMEIDCAIRDEGDCYNGGSFLIDSSSASRADEAFKDFYNTSLL